MDVRPKRPSGDAVVSEPRRIAESVVPLVETLWKLQAAQPNHMHPQPDDYDAETGELLREKVRSAEEWEELNANRDDLTEAKATREELEFALTEGAKMDDEQWAEWMAEWKERRHNEGLRMRDRGKKPEKKKETNGLFKESISTRAVVEKEPRKGVSKSGVPYCFVDLLGGSSGDRFWLVAAFWGEQALHAGDLDVGDVIGITGRLSAGRDGKLEVKAEDFQLLTP